MTFTPGIPTTGQSLGNTRQDIQNNFTNYFNVMSVNHVAPNVSPGQGKHKFLQMPEQGSDPTTAADEGGLYVKEGTGNIAQLFWRNESDGAIQQLTGAFSASPNGYVTVFGFLIQWGSASVPQGTNQTINVPIGYTSNVYAVMLNCGASIGQNAEAASVVGTPGLNSFVARTSAGTSARTVTFISIGI